MDARAKERSAQPLSVIGCLTAGFQILNQNLWLIALPVLVDLLLWMGPRLSIAPLLQGFTAFLRAQRAPDPQTGYQLAQAAELLRQFGEKFNLLSLLAVLPLLQVPSLLAQHAPGALSPLGQPEVFPIRDVLMLLGWALLLIPAGLLLGFLYLNGLARCVAVTAAHGESAQAGAQPEIAPVGCVGGLVRILLFVAVLLGTLAVFAPLWALLVGMVSAIAQSLGILVWMLGVGLVAYVALHLLFVVHGVVLGGRGLLRAIWESILLFQLQFPSVVWLLLLVVVVYSGLGYAWSLPPGDSWLLAIGILGNGCVATGLTAATFVFYQERVKYLPQVTQAK
jgi:hypothetical protein